MLSRRSLQLLLVLLFLFPCSSFAEPMAIGFLSFDVFITGEESPGANVFTIANLTGDPLLDGFALPPDFPVFSSLTLLSGTLTLTGSGDPIVLSLGDLGPGFFNSATFSETDLFSSAVFSATLDQSSFSLDGGGAFIPSSLTVTATLLPTDGSYLTPGVDFVVISVPGNPSTLPEPSTLLLLGTGLVALVKVRRKIQV
jgi:hypothetical protein